MPAADHPATGRADWFEASQIEELLGCYLARSAVPGDRWDTWRDAHMRLPPWFQPGLDPWSETYAQQQHRLWRLVAGVEHDYRPEQDEKEFAFDGSDVVSRPGFYARRDAQAITSAADHLLAMGMVFKHSGLRAGDRALEYGAGFGQIALGLARMGVHVDTVDISAALSGAVQQQADHFQVPLQSHVGRFGDNPCPGRRYQLIFFYESFHHCVDFQAVVPQLAESLAEGGRIVLGGEPIVEHPYAAVPYPWGVRLHSEVAVVMRQTRWFELGFTEAFLYELFARSGLVGRRVDCEPSPYGRLYVFERATALRPGGAGST